MTHRSSVVLSDGLKDAIETLSRESYKREDVPDLSQSEAIRQLIQAGIEHSDLTDLMSEHELVALRREQVKNENKLRDWREGFEGRVKQETVRRFKNGYTPDGLAKFSVGMKDEARVLWWDDDNPEHVERRREAIEYVDRVVEQAREDYDRSEHDPLDVETMFASFSGVSEGEARERLEGVNLGAEARQMIDQAPDPDPEAIATALANRHEIEVDLARQFVREVIEDD